MEKHVIIYKLIPIDEAMIDERTLKGTSVHVYGCSGGDTNQIKVKPIAIDGEIRYLFDGCVK